MDTVVGLAYLYLLVLGLVWVVSVLVFACDLVFGPLKSIKSELRRVLAYTTLTPIFVITFLVVLEWISDLGQYYMRWFGG
jgi:hypothetical protein